MTMKIPATTNPTQRLKKRGLALFLLNSTLFIFFQNCGPGFSRITNTLFHASQIEGENRSFEERLAELESKRNEVWRPKHPFWEVVYDGVDTPGDNVPGPFMWDNPIDDDWFDPLLFGENVFLDQFRLNTPGRGLLTVDRNYLATGKTGSLFRRDEYLAPSFTRALFGITLEVRVKLMAKSQPDSFFINYVGSDCTISVSLSGATALSSVGTIASGSIYGNHSGHIAFDTTSDFVTLRLVRGPQFKTFSVYVVAYASPDAIKPAQFQKLHDGTCDSGFKVGSAPGINFPYVQVGDNSNDAGKNASYILDFVRYRRDAILPEDPLQSLQSRTPPALPDPPVGNDENSFLYGFFGDVPVDSPEAKFLMGQSVIVGGPTTSFKPSGLQGVIQLQTGNNGHADIEIGKPFGLVDQGGFTIEARLKALPDHGQRGFRISFLDQLGSVSMFISADRVETALGTKPAGFQSHRMDTTDGFHIYRIVRKAGELYAHLYVDNDPVPVIVDQHLSAETESRGFDANPILSFGGFRIYPEPFVLPVKTTSANILIDYIRWHSSSHAPSKR